MVQFHMKFAGKPLYRQVQGNVNINGHNNIISCDVLSDSSSRKAVSLTQSSVILKT